MTRFGKMMLRAGLAAMAVGIAGSAQAAEYLFSFGGTVTGSTGSGGPLFGVAANSLNGRRFSATIIFNDATPGLIQDYVGDPYRSRLFGGTANPTTGSLTINGFSFSTIANSRSGGTVSLFNNLPSIPPVDQLSISTYSSESTGTYATEFFERSVTFSGGLLNNNTRMINSLNLADLPGFVYNPADSATFNDGFQVYELVFRNNQLIREDVTRGGFLIDSFTVSLVGAAAVPEPASWAMIIAGFGLVGGAMRRRRGQTVKVGYAA
jgi:PEP-CTERM motif